MDERRRHMRSRLYSAYSTTHAGKSDDKADRLAFRGHILPHLPTSRQIDVLDVGCGQGALVRQLLQHGYSRAWGIDVSPEQVAIAHATGLASIKLGDFRESLRDATLDVAIATDFFEHLTKYEALEAADHIFAALRPGGRLIMRVPNAISPFGGNYRHGDLTHETSYTPRSLHQLGRAAGFAAISTVPCPPPICGATSLLRRAVWGVASGAMKVTMAAETGQLSGVPFTQNVVALMVKRA